MKLLPIDLKIKNIWYLLCLWFKRWLILISCYFPFTATDVVSTVNSIDHAGITYSLSLLRTEPTYAQPEQLWQFVSDLSVSCPNFSFVCSSDHGLIFVVSFYMNMILYVNYQPKKQILWKISVPDLRFALDPKALRLPNPVSTYQFYQVFDNNWSLSFVLSTIQVSDYSGTYTIQLIPCTTLPNTIYSQPPTCNPEDTITFELPIRFQQVSQSICIGSSLLNSLAMGEPGGHGECMGNERMQ